MDYEKKYKEALKKAKDMLSYKEVRREDMEYLFPELKESEDEKIRKGIIELVKQSSEILDKKNQEQMLDWLEKQGEQAIISHKFNVGDWIVSKWGGIYQIKEVMSGSYNLLCTNNAEEINSITQVDNNSRLLCIADIKKLEKQGEQKPKWTDEDEENFRDIIGAIHSVAYQPTEDEEARISWLKSIKQRLEEQQ